MKAIQSQNEVKIMKKVLFMTLLLLNIFILIGCTQTTTEKFISIDYYEITKTVTLGQITLDENDLIASIALGGTHSIALSSQGRVFTWGNNTKGQLGDGTTERNLLPVEITHQFSLTEDDYIQFVTLGDMHSAALSSKGRLFTWGWNFNGRLGDGTTTSRFVPTEITSIFNLENGELITKVALSVSSSAAVTSNGRVFTWGENASGQLGDGTIYNKSTPVDITSQFNLTGNDKVIDISLGQVHSAALTASGSLFTWGSNTYGQLGNGTNNLHITPIDMTNFFNLNSSEVITSISLGGNHSMAITSENRIFTWGNNVRGQIGNGTFTNVNLPTNITQQFAFEANEGVQLSSSGRNFGMIITTLGRVFSWGENTNGQLGDGLDINLSTPKDVTTQFNLVSLEENLLLSTGESHSTILTTYGKIIIWGDNENGKFGDNTTTDSYSPLEITLINTTQTLLKNETVSLSSSFILYSPELEGYAFDGWYTDSSLITKFNASGIVPISDLTLYGEWIIED